MVVSMRVMSAGTGYQYLLRSVAAGEGERSLSAPITRYYAEAGTPPGRWLGSGLGALGSGELSSGDPVTEPQLALLIGLGRDPISGEQLGRSYPVYGSVEERVARRVAALDGGLIGEERASAKARIEAEEAVVSRRRPVAGYDVTFSVPKSVSTLWGVADANLQEMILEAHHGAVAEVLDYVEREVAATRTGVAAINGAVAQVGVRGIIASAFDHWDSRSGDPQLHTHVVISNKVQAVLDGRWRSLDGRPMHAAITALSPYYDALLADRLTGMFGIDWEQRVRGTNMHPHAEISGVPERLLAEFSSRARDIDRAVERLVIEYVASHGRHPSNAIRIRLRAQATIETRPEKEIRSLRDLTREWRARAGRVLGTDPVTWARAVATTGTPSCLLPQDISTEAIAEVSAEVVAAVGKKRSTWRRWNLWSEASRQTMHWRFASAEDREQVITRVVAAAEDLSVALTPAELAPSPPEFRRDDGTSVFRPRHSTLYSSTEILAAEDRLLARAEYLYAPRVPARIVERVARHARDGHRLTTTQGGALVAVATSGRQLDVLVGPAGAGKTTAMNALRIAWRKVHGPGAVIGLAPSAAAAAVLAADLGIPCENTARWLTLHARGRTAFRRDQLVIIDEATLADTATLDRITALAAEAGAKVLLVGDWAQLQSVDAGGAFGMLAQARPDMPELTEIHRFTHDWEKTASLGLRAGRPESIAAYARNHRLRDGTTQEMLNSAYESWTRDTELGLRSVLVAESTDLVRSLNAQARADRVLSGATESAREAALSDGNRASAGDYVITRHNNRRLRTSSGLWVRNGDLWRVKFVRRDGALVVRPGSGGHRAAIVLPPEYVASHVELGYAITTHRAQGLTVDTAHVLASSRTTRENLYVGMTRGRESNQAYVALDQPDESHAAPMTDEDLTASNVLYGVLQHAGTELSAHQAAAAEALASGSIAQLAAEYETIAAAAQRGRWTALVHSSGLTRAQADAVLSSNAFGPMSTMLRLAETLGHDVAQLLPSVVARHNVDDAADIAAVLRHRLRLTTRSAPHPSGRFVAGLIPAALGPMTQEHREALDRRAELIEQRAHELVEQALRSREPWVVRAGSAPSESQDAERWKSLLCVVAAYRDRYHCDSDLPVGVRSATEAEHADRTRARQAWLVAAELGYRDRVPPVQGLRLDRPVMPG
ncbi:MobF family relaxase [Nocardioides sp. NPDC004968]|uniref:MobF family relaxase n=1 Tax=Nocardioides sp. NPDC004968 TaxID=3155894 RepID=UPI0033AD1CC4